MRRVLLLVALGAALANAAQAEIYRCVTADGGVRFVGDPSTCETATRQGLTREIQHFGSEDAERAQPEASPSGPESAASAKAGNTPSPQGEVTPSLPAAHAPRLERLEDLYLDAKAAGRRGHWEVVNEAPVDAAADPDFLRWGVREKLARHYTHRNDTGRVRVCSVELWEFVSEAKARIAQENLSFPNWRFDRRGRVLVMLHAVSRERGEHATHSVFAECSRLGARIAARAENLSR